MHRNMVTYIHIYIYIYTHTPILSMTCHHLPSSCKFTALPPTPHGPLDAALHILLLLLLLLMIMIMIMIKHNTNECTPRHGPGRRCGCAARGCGCAARGRGCSARGRGCAARGRGCATCGGLGPHRLYRPPNDGVLRNHESEWHCEQHDASHFMSCHVMHSSQQSKAGGR